ncbi:MAG: putative rane protein [Marmoricola sp.]|nr:putative rane protein [Marmoricola sp.]
MTSCGHEHEDGAYVLGALTPDDRLAFERHLPGCAACAASVRELAGLPGLLARVPVGLLDPAEVPTPLPETLLPGLLRRAGQARRRRTWVTGGLVAASVAAAVAVGVAGFAGHDSGSSPTASPPTSAARQLTPIGARSISGWVSLTPVAWGTRVDLTCAYGASASDYTGATFAIYVVRSDGTTERMASWRALPGQTSHVAGSTATKSSDIKDLEVRDAAGTTVLDLAHG